MKKWLIIVPLGIVILGVLAAMYNTHVTNAGVASEVRNNPQGERAGIVTLLTFPDGKTIPVNYLKEGNQVFIGADGPWWRQFPDTQSNEAGTKVNLLIRGQNHVGYGTTELKDQAYIDDVFSRLRPTVPEWLPDWLNGKLIIIELKQK